MPSVLAWGSGGGEGFVDGRAPLDEARSDDELIDLLDLSISALESLNFQDE